jgi:hypothetical protein
MQTKPPPEGEGVDIGSGKLLHHASDVCSLESFGPLEEVELDCFAFIQGTIAVFLDG